MLKNSRNKMFFLISVLFLAASMVTLAVSVELSEESNWNLEDLKEVELDSINRIYMDLAGANIFFDENLENVYMDDELKIDRLGSRITISSPNQGLFNIFDNSDYKIVIGTKNTFRLIDIDAGGIILKGKLFADELNIDAGGVNMSGEYYCERVNIDGAGMAINAYIETEYLNIDGAGIDLDLEVRGIEDIRIDGVGIDADLKYLDKWDGVRHLSINGIGGNFDVRIPDSSSSQNSSLDIDSSGIIDTDVVYY
ncbi:MAG: hypothetical protein ACLFPF_10325 [Halanaerobiales bacterium]